MKTNITKWSQAVAAGLLLAGVVLLASGCAEPAPVAYSEPPAYDYYYYPHANVYFYPSARVYYWHDGAHWRSGHQVPTRYAFHAEEHHENLRLHSRQPWTEHHPDYH